ncbi:prephenate dehydratase [Tichowtungia aerotolerans]|uniref:Bifunctional chorismate mutase/prephenate dehydratase n=1 Tax=Tichowtungia aerotolerans TaxID=2697043 RepID=A0A6P1MBW4_9BACT|nr:prephenate dehydratase [Tichowtungia aerotolerans]QHI69578.1 prephenate dehydratase [Tichowtungia aerotolerans]
MSLDKLRKKIDQLDAQLVKLLNERVSVALEIGKTKKEQGGEIYVPSREKAVFERISELNKGGSLPDKSARAIYREIMSAALALESNLRICYLGPPATFTHQAARSKFGASVEYHPAGSIADVFAAVENGNADYGVVPIENSTEGAVTHTFDQFTGTTLKICAEIYLPISLCLMASVSGEKVSRICSKQEALGQCRHWLNANMSGIEFDAVNSTTLAAEMASKSDCAAIASHFAAELYGLDILAENIQDVSGNTTRFLVIGAQCSEPTGDDKTSIYFGTKHKAGALHDALGALQANGINMSKIESRPSGDKVWEYVFFVDFEGHADNPNVKKALKEMEDHCAVLTVLGSYPKAG